MKTKKNQLQLFGILKNGCYILAEFVVSNLRDLLYRQLFLATTKEELAIAIDKARDVTGFIKTRAYQPLQNAIYGRRRRTFKITYLKWLQRVTLKMLRGLKKSENVDNLNMNTLEKKWFYESRALGQLPFNLRYNG